MDKKTARKILFGVIDGISDKKSKSEKITDLLLSLLKKYDTVAVYTSTAREVDTFPLIEKLLADGKTVALPRVCGENMEFYKIDRSFKTSLSVGRFGIKEPKGDKEDILFKTDIEAIVCPAVGFDMSLSRLGHGGGYYDRYLKNCPAYKIGVCFSEQITENLPCESFDVKMDAVVTETGVIT